MKPKNKSEIKSYFYENRFIYAALIAPAILLTIVFCCFRLSPLGGITILRMDLFHQYAPFFTELYNKLTSLDSLQYSWTMGLGGNFLGNFFNYLASPVSAIILLFGQKNIPEAAAAMILVKCCLSSAAMAYYLKKSQSRNDITLPAFALLYSFCGYFIAYYWNIMWLDALALFPLVILGIENIINAQKCGLYLFALSFTMFSSYYMAFMVCIFSVFYFLTYYFSHYKINDRLDGFIKNEGFFTDEDLICDDFLGEAAPEPYVNGSDITCALKASRFLKSGLLFALASLSAALLLSFALLPTYFSLKTCSATSDSFPKDFKDYFNIFDFLANHLASVSPTIRSSGNDVMPNVYCGVLTILLLPVYFFCKSLKTSEKVAHLLLLIVLFFSFNINFLNFIWHGFHFPNDLPYRFSFMYSFILIVMAYKIFIRLSEYSLKELLGSGLGVIAFVILAQKLGSKNLQTQSVYISIAFAAIYTFILLQMRSKKFKSFSLSLLLFISVAAETCIADVFNFVMNVEKASYMRNYDDFKDMKQTLDGFEDGGFYRMELASLKTRNDPSLYNYNGVSVFSSMTYESVAKIQKRLGLDGNNINSFTYHPQTPLYNAMFSIGYVLNNSDSFEPNEKYYSQTAANDAYTAYLNNYRLPLAFGVNKEISQWEYNMSNPFLVQNRFFSQATGINEDLFNETEFDNARYENITYLGDELKSGAYSYSKAVEDKAGSVWLNVAAKSENNLYLYVVSSDLEEIGVASDGFSATQNIAHPYILDIGSHAQGEDIEIEIKVKADAKKTGTFEIYLYEINDEVWRNGYKILSENAMEITKFDTTEIEGKITADRDLTLFTSIPFDGGWSVYVDGKKTDNIEKIGDALLGINLSEGSHTVRLKFTAQGLLPGIVMSGGCFIILITYAVIRNMLKKALTSPAKTIEETVIEFNGGKN